MPANMEPIADTPITGREGVGRACCSRMVVWRMSIWGVHQYDMPPHTARGRHAAVWPLAYFIDVSPLDPL